MRLAFLLIPVAALLSACAGKPLQPYAVDSPPMILAPVAAAGIVDQRARFREVYCAVLTGHGPSLPDYRPCEQALTRVGVEPAGTGVAVDLNLSKRGLVALVVPGVGYECFEPWLEPGGTVAAHLRTQGYDEQRIRVDALSGSAHNARQIRDALMSMPMGEGMPRVVLVGYSKGAPDILEALVAYPEIRDRVVAFVSAAGAVGGSPLANAATQSQAELMRHFPHARCEAGDGGAIESLRPATRHKWLAEHPLPAGIRYYSLATLPQPERLSRALRSSYRKLARVDGRNDSQVIIHDQLIPGSTLLGYINADHWAIALPISRTHPTASSLLVTQNAYPREALLEAVLRFVEEDLQPRH